jgi:S-layer homology domain.
VRRRLSLILVVALLLATAIPFGVAAAGDKPQNDIAGHWAENALQAWSDKGLLKGQRDGRIMPNATITRAELFALVNRSFGFTDTKESSFTDVSPGQWYYNDVAQAVAAGYATGYDDGTFKPMQNVTRQEMAVIVARLLRLSSSESASQYEDTANSPAWSRGSIGAVIDSRIIVGSKGLFKPADFATRAEAVVILDRALQQRNVIYSAAGTYGPETGLAVIDNDVVIDAPGVTLQNTEIKGNLTISANVGEGDVYLKGVKVDGTTTVNGGGEHSVHLTDSVVVKVLVNKQTGSVRIVAEGGSSIQEVTLQSGATVASEAGASVERVTLSNALPKDSKITLSGTFETVNVLASSISIQIPQGTIQDLTVGQSASGVAITTTNNVAISKLVLDAVAKVLGQGLIQNAAINASGATIESTPQQVTVASDVQAEVGGRPVTGTVSNSGAAGGGGSSGGSTVAANKTSLKAAIDQAQNLFDNAVEGIELDQYPFGSKSALQSAIAAANSVYNDTSGTQTAVDSALATLNVQIMNFNAAQNSVSVVEALADKYKLSKTVYNSLSIGEGPGETTEADKKAFYAAILAARQVVNNKNATPLEISDAYSALGSAWSALSSARNPNDMSWLEQVVAQADTMISNATEGTEVGQYKEGAIALLQLSVTIAKNMLTNSQQYGDRWEQYEVTNRAIWLLGEMNKFEAEKIAESDALITFDANDYGSNHGNQWRPYFSVTTSVYGTLYIVPYTEFPQEASEVVESAVTSETIDSSWTGHIDTSELIAGDYKLYMLDDQNKLSRAFVDFHVAPDVNTMIQPSVESAYANGHIVNTIEWIDSPSTDIYSLPITYVIKRRQTNDPNDWNAERENLVFGISQGVQSYVDEDPDLLPGTSYMYDISATYGGIGEFYSPAFVMTAAAPIE